MNFKLFFFVVLGVFFLSNGAKAQDKDTSIVLKVKGITCATDYKMIQTNIEKLSGIQNFEVGKQGATSTFVVIFDPELVSQKKICAAIEGTGSCENPDERPYKVKQKNKRTSSKEGK